MFHRRRESSLRGIGAGKRGGNGERRTKDPASKNRSKRRTKTNQEKYVKCARQAFEADRQPEVL